MSYKIILSSFLILLFCQTANATNWCNHANNVGCFLMEGSTTETDLSQYGNDLSVSSGDTIPRSSDRKFGSWSRDFEADDIDYLEHADGLETDVNGANAQLTITAWIKPESVGTVAYTPVCKYTFSGDNRQYCFFIDTNEKIDFFKSNTSASGVGFDTTESSSSIVVDVWTHVAVVYDDVDMRIYINGSLDGTPLSETGGIFDGTMTFRIGDQNGNLPFDGLIDDVGIFNTALTSSEINEIMNSGLVPENENIQIYGSPKFYGKPGSIKIY